MDLKPVYCRYTVKMPYWLYRNSSLIWETVDGNAASCSPGQTNASQLRDNCVTFQSLVTACIVAGGRPAGELWLCVCACIHAFEWDGDWGAQECRGEWTQDHVCETVCETMKAIPLGSKSLHSWRTWVIWFSAVQKKLKVILSQIVFNNFTFCLKQQKISFCETRQEQR